MPWQGSRSGWVGGENTLIEAGGDGMGFFFGGGETKKGDNIWNVNEENI
jgi:hypothetical protein